MRNKSEEEVVLAEVESGDDSTDSDPDIESKPTEVTLPSTSSGTRSRRKMRPRAQEEYFIFYFLLIPFFNTALLKFSCIYKGWWEGSQEF